MAHAATFKQSRQEQLDSVLFERFPGEVRDKIFTFALNCYEDANKLWDVNTPYVRPGYSAAQVADTALLQTCQRIYAENWFRPWVSAVNTFYLTSQDRRPEDGYVTTIEQFQRRLNRLYVDHGEVEVSHVQVFAQMYALESLTSDLIPILCMDNFFPRKLTVSIRHHDWWWWENDHRLKIDGAWIRVCRFPDSLKEICIELESLKRKQNQIDYIADEMVQSWHLRRLDGTIMTANKEDFKMSAWSGSSTWGGERWVRDETLPGVNEYYVKTITWKPNREKTNRTWPRNLQVPESFPVITGNPRKISVASLEFTGIPAGLSGDETVRRFEEWLQQHRHPAISSYESLHTFGETDSDTESEDEDHMEFQEADPEAVESEDEAIDMAGEPSPLGQDNVEDAIMELSQAAENDQATDNADGEVSQSETRDGLAHESYEDEDMDEDSDGDEADEGPDGDEDDPAESSDSDELQVVFEDGFDEEDQDMSGDDFSDDDGYEDDEEFEDESAED